jgi:hypothetical protein
MNTEQHPHDHQSPEPPPAEAAERDPAAGMAPEAIQAADIDREKQPAEGVDVEKPTRGVDWVRPSDLLSRGSGYVSSTWTPSSLVEPGTASRSAPSTSADRSPQARGGCLRCRRSAARSPRPSRRVWAGSDQG